MKIRTLQCEIQRLKIQTMIEISKNIVTPSVALFEKGTHVERSGYVFVHKCAKMVATITKLPFCTKGVPVLIEGQNFSSIRYIDPVTNSLYHNYTIAACNPLYPNVVKLEDGSFQQYGQTLKKFNREIYQWFMNNNLNIIDENLHRSLFSISDVILSQIARTIRHNSKGIISREAFQNSDGKYSHENFIHWNAQFQKQFFLTNEITVFRNLKTKNLYVWLKSKDIAVSVLTVCLKFQVVKNFPKLFIYLGLVINGASWQQLLRYLDPVTGTRMYNQLIKLNNERREQKKMIEEKESLKEWVV